MEKRFQNKWARLTSRACTYTLKTMMSHRCWGRTISAIFYSTLLRYNLHMIKCINLNCAAQWLFTYVYNSRTIFHIKTENTSFFLQSLFMPVSNQSSACITEVTTILTFRRDHLNNNVNFFKYSLQIHSRTFEVESESPGFIPEVGPALTVAYGEVKSAFHASQSSFVQWE